MLGAVRSTMCEVLNCSRVGVTLLQNICNHELKVKFSDNRVSILVRVRKFSRYQTVSGVHELCIDKCLKLKVVDLSEFSLLCHVTVKMHEI
jgi:hypothetical protein